VPWLWFLTRSANSRIFQKKNVVDIVTQVFSDHGFSDFEFHTQRTYKEYEYKVQYRETDFNFVSRLLEHECIFYFFQHENGKHKAVFGDSASVFKPGEQEKVSFVRTRNGSTCMAGITPTSSGPANGR
jgi:type VI secretion system secreted protein VgrG